MSFDFDSAVLQVKTLPTRPTDDELLTLYGLYKQALEGDITTSKPGFWNPTARAKWDSWYDQKGYTSEEAKELYIKQVIFLIGKY